MATSYSPKIITDGLILCLDAADKKSYSGSGSTWTDRSGNGSNGTLTNGPTFNSASGGAFTLDGSNDYITSPVPLAAGATTYTIEAVFKPHSNKTQVVWEQNTSSLVTGRRVCMILISDGDGGFNGQSADRHDHMTYTLNEWNFWSITMDTSLASNKIKMYINGVFDSQGNTSNDGALNAGADLALLGKKVTASSEFFDGEIAQVKVYNRVLTSSEVLQNFNATKSRFGL